MIMLAYSISKLSFRLITAFLIMGLLVGCSAGGALSLLTGGGPNVAANTQAGKTNTQTVGQTNVTEQKLVRPTARNIEQSTGNNKVRAERVQTVVVHEKDAAWLIWGFALMTAVAAAGWIHGWLTPSPRERKLLKKVSYS